MSDFFSQKFKRYRVKKNLKVLIEPEEILLDAAKAPELDDQKIEVPIRPKIFQIFFGIIFVSFLILAGQTFYLQIVKGSSFQQLSERNSTRSLPIFASRGIIYDYAQKQLVYNVPGFDLVVMPQDLPQDEGQRYSVISKVAAILGKPEQDIKDAIDKLKKSNFKSSQSSNVATNIEHDKILTLETQLPNLPGFRIEESAVRQYLFAPYFSQILGYMGKLEAADLQTNPDYFMTEKIGKSGLEYSYEEILRGQPGEKLIEVDSLGRQKAVLSETKPKNGSGLILTLDSELQSFLASRLTEKLKSTQLNKAAAVAINPKDGGILALVSLPSFDNNIFTNGLSSKVYADLVSDPNQPFFDRAIAGQYAPGSIIKPIIGASALQEGVINKSTTIFDTGELVLVNQYNPAIVYRFPDWKAHGEVNIYSAIAQSCDVFFYAVGGGYGSIKGLGLDRLDNYFHLFGLGEKLGIDLPGESTGLVPTAEWKKEEKGEDWYTGDTYHLSIGQGDLLITPLQMAAATAAIANGGRLFVPHLVDKIVDSDKNVINAIEPKIIRDNFISSENLDIITKAMRQTVTAGSALLLNGLPVPVAAKTGTAQVAGQANSNAWVSVFAPYNDPKIVLVILIENSGEGSQVAVPVARDVLEWYFNK